MIVYNEMMRVLAVANARKKINESLKEAAASR
jgi:hypothetical protein